MAGRMIPDKETLTVEFKSDLKKYDDSRLFEDVVAFANTEGGELYLGIEDDGTITGLHKEHLNIQTLNAFIANNTVPPVASRIEIIDEGKLVARISVPKSVGVVVATRSGKMLRRRLKSDGTPENIPMYPNEITTRLSDLRLLDYSALVVFDGSYEDIDFIEIERLRRNIEIYSGDQTLSGLENTELLKALGLLREMEGVFYPTVAGILMLGKSHSIQRFVPTSGASFQVTSGSTVIVNEDYNLPVLAAIEKIIDHISARNTEAEFEIGLHRMSIPEFDRRALREAIVNAFCHRDYSLMGRVRVHIADEGLVIANPGGFIEGVNIKNLLNAEPHGRNQTLADALKRVGLAEKTGRGIDRIFEGSLTYGRQAPDYSGSTSTTVSLFIPRSNPDPELIRIIVDEQQRTGRPLTINMLLIINMLRDMPKSTVSQLSDAINMQEAVVRNVLARAVEDGLVNVQGSGNYILSRALYKSNNNGVGNARKRDIDESSYLEMIKNMAKNSEFISRADVAELLRVKESKAYTLLKALVKAGAIEAVNKGRYAKYRLKNKQPKNI